MDKQIRAIISPQNQNFNNKKSETEEIGNSYSSYDVIPKRKKAALVALVKNSELFGMKQTIREIEDRFNRNFNYPYILLNDEQFTEEFKQGVTRLTKANVTFGTLESESWGYPSWIDQEKAKKVRETVKYHKGDSESYRFMCRFQSGYIFRHPLLQNLEYYWRIEPDVNYFCDIEYDPFDFMSRNSKIYGWNIALGEVSQTIPTLWRTTKRFMKKYPQHIAKDNILEWVMGRKGRFNGCHFWSNFEIVNLNFYRSQAYLDYFNYLDRAGGFFYERWGDAPIHTLAVAMFLSIGQVHMFGDIGYRHHDIGMCPDKNYESGKCVCSQKTEKAQAFICRRKWVSLDNKRK